jgi:hypothetical protein
VSKIAYAGNPDPRKSLVRLPRILLYCSRRVTVAFVYGPEVLLAAVVYNFCHSFGSCSPQTDKAPTDRWHEDAIEVPAGYHSGLGTRVAQGLVVIVDSDGNRREEVFESVNQYNEHGRCLLRGRAQQGSRIKPLLEMRLKVLEHLFFLCL